MPAFLRRVSIPLFLNLAIWFALISPCSGEILQLKNGDTLEGEILEQGETHTQVKLKYGTMSVSNADIFTISSSIPSPMKPKPVPQEPAISEEETEPVPVPESPKGPVLFTPSDKITLTEIEKRAVLYFWEQSDPQTGLIRDRSRQSSPASIAACGFGLTALCIGAERGWLEKRAVRERVRTMLTFFKDRAQNEHGFFYHFLNMSSGKREWNSEISSVDNALLMAGILFAGQYYRGSILEQYARTIFNRVDWPWMLNGGNTIALEWKPEGGFSASRWDTYAEHLVLYILALGSQSHPIPKESWNAWSRKPKTYEGFTYIHNPQESLFVYLFSHAWINFKGKRDGGIDYWRNSVRAIKANRKFTLNNRKRYKTYRGGSWGLSETDGPDGYKHYGATENGHDGTVAPYAMISSINFVPDRSKAAIQAMTKNFAHKIWGNYGFTSGFNVDRGWYSLEYIGIHVGLTALMLENYRSQFVWKTMMLNPVVQKGMRRARL